MSSRFSAKFTLSSCQNLLSMKVHILGGEYGDDPFNLVCYVWQRLQAAFPTIQDILRHQLCLLSATLSFSPLIMFLIRSCHGLIYDPSLQHEYPVSFCPIGWPAVHGEYPNWSLWGSPVTCHQLASLFEMALCLLPSGGAVLAACSQPSHRLPRGPPFQSYPLFPHNRVKLSLWGRISYSPQHGVWCSHPSLMLQKPKAVTPLPQSTK